MNSVLDEKSKRLLGILKNNSRESFTEMAKQMGMSEGAIRKRIKSLVKNRVITKFTIESNDGQYPVKAIIMVKLEAKASTDKLVAYIKTLHGASNVCPITGGYDIYVDARVSSNKELHAVISAIREQKGVVSTSTMTILS